MRKCTWVCRVLAEEYSPENPRVEMDMVTDWCGVHMHLLFPNILVLIRSEELLDAHSPLKWIADLAYHRRIFLTRHRIA
jgi:hypothetical protein